MTKKQLKLLFTETQTLALLEKNMDIVNSIPGFPALLNKYREIINIVIEVSHEHGYIEDPKIRKEVIKQRTATAKMAAEINRRMDSYAKLSGNITLSESIIYTESKLSGTLDNIFIEDCLSLYTLAEKEMKTTLVFGLSGITTKMMYDFDNAIYTFKKMINQPNGRKSDNNIIEAMKGIENLLPELTRMVDSIGTVEDSHKKFHFEYWTIRRVIDRPKPDSLKRKIRGHEDVYIRVTDSVSFDPIESAKASFYSHDSLVFITFTLDTGGVYCKLDEGLYTVEIFKLGYNTKKLEVNITKGETTRILVGLDK